jgi:hypothetical protein
VSPQAYRRTFRAAPPEPIAVGAAG